MKTKEQILKILEDIDNDEENEAILEKAMHFYCSTYDVCEGYKHAIRLCIEDQFDNEDLETNLDEQNALKQLEAILTK